jgi:hypothetical protein
LKILWNFIWLVIPIFMIFKLTPIKSMLCSESLIFTHNDLCHN